jgi:hypothetical protein
VGWKHGLDWSGSVWGEVARSCECSNEYSVFIQSRKC